MPEQHSEDPPGARREWWIAAALVAGVIVCRSAIFVFWERSHFDSDQAITGLMAKHLAEGRAFPVFWYGQSYMLAVESWLAVPLFVLFGASVTALKLPLLGINLAIGLLLLRGFVRDLGLRPLTAVLPTLFFALPAAGTSARLLEANGGNVEPFLYVLLIWSLRSRALLCGIVFGLGFLHREFTLYGLLALLAIEALCGELFTTAGARRRMITIASGAGVWLFVQWIKQFSSGAGPGTSLADVYRPQDNISALAARVCIDPQTVAAGFYKLATEHWPVLFGTLPEPLRDFGVRTAVSQGAPWSGLLLGVIVLISLTGLLRARRLAGAGFSAFLVLTALFSIGGYVIGRCGAIDFYFMRYELLSILGIAGLGGWFLRVERAPRWRQGWIALAVLWFILVAIPHVKLYDEYLRHPPEDVRRTLIAHLDARGARYGESHYWIAYAITFLTDERIVMKSEDFVRIREYERIVDAHPGEVWRVSREACGEEIMPRLYVCKR
ncbi:MAG: hypothetical protein H0U19_01770 [Acidobacteria bacterium]|nr:hypothetical protein [Acidobacteriota bacterium]